MKIRQKLLLTIFFSIILISCTSSVGWPKKGNNFQIVVGDEMGGRMDSVARILATALEKELPIPVVIKNVPGESSRLSYDYTYSQPSDGYTVVLSNSREGIWPQYYLQHVEEWSPADWKTLGVFSQLSDMGLVTHKNSPWTDFSQLIEDAKSRPFEISIGTLGPGRFDDLWVLELQEFFHVDFNWQLYNDTKALRKDIEEEAIDVGIIQTQTNELHHNDLFKVLTVIGSSLPKGYPEDIPTLKDFEEKLNFKVENLHALNIPTSLDITVKADIEEDVYHELASLMESIFVNPDWEQVMPEYTWPTYFPPHEADSIFDEMASVLKRYQSSYEVHFGGTSSMPPG